MADTIIHKNARARPLTLPSNSPLLRLVDHPTIDFEQMRRRVQADQSQLGAVLQDIGAADQGLLRAINDNQVDFIALINQGIERVRELQRQARAAGCSRPTCRRLGLRSSRA